MYRNTICPRIEWRKQQADDDDSDNVEQLRRFNLLTCCLLFTLHFFSTSFYSISTELYSSIKAVENSINMIRERACLNSIWVQLLRQTSTFSDAFANLTCLFPLILLNGDCNDCVILIAKMDAYKLRKSIHPKFTVKNFHKYFISNFSEWRSYCMRVCCCCCCCSLVECEYLTLLTVYSFILL